MAPRPRSWRLGRPVAAAAGKYGPSVLAASGWTAATSVLSLHRDRLTQRVPTGDGRQLGQSFIQSVRCCASECCQSHNLPGAETFALKVFCRLFSEALYARRTLIMSPALCPPSFWRSCASMFDAVSFLVVFPDSLSNVYGLRLKFVNQVYITVSQLIS
jgi:hypothetical protein